MASTLKLVQDPARPVRHRRRCCLLAHWLRIPTVSAGSEARMPRFLGEFVAIKQLKTRAMDDKAVTAFEVRPGLVRGVDGLRAHHAPSVFATVPGTMARPRSNCWSG